MKQSLTTSRVFLGQIWIQKHRSASSDITGVSLSHCLGKSSPSTSARVRSPAPGVKSRPWIHQVGTGGFVRELVWVEQAQMQRPKERKFVLVRRQGYCWSLGEKPRAPFTSDQKRSAARIIVLWSQVSWSKFTDGLRSAVWGLQEPVLFKHITYRVSAIWTISDLCEWDSLLGVRTRGWPSWSYPCKSGLLQQFVLPLAWRKKDFLFLSLISAGGILLETFEQAVVPGFDQILISSFFFFFI